MPDGRRVAGAAIGAALAAIAGALLRREFGRFEVAEESMAPALLPGDYLLTRRVSGSPLRGQIVVFPHPARHRFYLTKRVVGLPGERIEISGGQVHVDGRPLAEPWADGPTLGDGSWDLEPGEVFVLGDRRALSADDGRSLGPIRAADIEWRAVLRYWPPDRLGRPAEAPALG